jgi:hypothetical protein
LGFRRFVFKKTFESTTQEPAAQGRQADGVCCFGKVFDSGYIPFFRPRGRGMYPSQNNHDPPFPEEFAGMSGSDAKLASKSASEGT